MAKRDYLVEAAKQIHMALDSEVNEDYEAAFSYYKNGVDLLLNGVQLDPNKERREAVKRKTTQYLKRAEEIFITYLQHNLGKGSSHLGGYSSLRFRPVRHLSSPVEDLEMCKVVGVSDKVLVVQSMVNKETFIVKSLMKSSWESREQPTIIPQGVPYMVKLLRYYVSEDAVYLHLEHVKGGRLFSKLHTLRKERAKEHPECISSGQNNIKMKSSYTSPAICTDYQRNIGMESTPQKLSDETPDVDDPRIWDWTQQRLESCGTHAYIEETGCLQNSRSAASFHTKLKHVTLLSGPGRTQVGASIHPPAPTLCLHTSQAQDKPALPLSCARVSQALNAMSGLQDNKAGVGLLECSLEFEVAWKAADPALRGEQANPYAVTDSSLKSKPHSNHTSSTKAEPPNSRSHLLSSSPAILHLPLHCQTQIHGITTTSHQASILSAADEVTHLEAKQASSSPTSEERNGVVVLRSTDQAVFSDHREARTTSGSSWLFSARKPDTEMKPSGETGAVDVREGIEEACEMFSPGQVVPPSEGSFSSWYSPRPVGAQKRTGESSMRTEGQADDQIIEVDGWCHIPRIPVKSSDKSAHRACWGLPESEVCVWGAQILLALESLHQQGIICRDLNPRNVLLTSNGKVSLTFFGQWSEVQSEINTNTMEQMYCAPEIGGVSRVTEACDWWSLGALLFELLTGMPLWQLHPAGINSHTQLLIPDHLSTAAASLLTELLQFDAGYRLGSGGGGVSDIKCHPFFSSVSWKALSC
ncbi:ribosomal protein S6 kinase delta-1 isoform X2 [Dunckerocampus dactyliophorus]|nr:ribosomal protein S6 kinase delta-1 isoform X2 [Dunckerocampus dactyliophorus]XP_054653062.1 ribosomal protein S6 kinase delta-1 isoform X2 [Dunckerocampus dactyliophorus]